MIGNNSPWLQQLKRNRPIAELVEDHHADVAIIGAGIAGIATAYFTLRDTDKSVVVIEAGKVAHGATGHNGGFLATYFERPFTELVEDFGLRLAAEGQKSIDSSWELLAEIRRDAGLQTPVWEFTGYTGCSSAEELMVHFQNNALKIKAGLEAESIMVSEHFPGLRAIPKQYKDLYSVIPQRDILALLETDDSEYIALLASHKGCMNSALFTEEVVGYLLATYPNRFTLAEHSPVRRLVLKNDHAVLMVNKDVLISAKHVVLCTNGFETIKIINTAGSDIDAKFHHSVRGIVGYMAGYTEELDKPPVEISYLPKRAHRGRDIFSEEPYFYLTRRPYEMENNTEHNLISVGGPELLLEDTIAYTNEHPYAEMARSDINNFLKQTYKHSPKDDVEFKFLWHGLMGFTPNGVRLIGPEPLNPVLMYNLGCNGVGLLPSIFGGKRIARFLSGERVEKSIFDPVQI